MQHIKNDSSFNSTKRVFVKGYGFSSFARNMRKNISKSISKNLSSKYSRTFLDHAKNSVTDALKSASKRARYISPQKRQQIIDDLRLM